jgi:hypothetical protein
MTTHNSRNASNSRNESRNRTTKTVGTPGKRCCQCICCEFLLLLLVSLLNVASLPSFLLSDSGGPATVDIDDVLSIFPVAAIISNASSVLTWCCGLRYFCKYSNSRRDNRKITDINSRRETRNSRMPEIVEVPTTVLESAGSPTAQYIDANNSLVFVEIRKKIAITAKYLHRN